MASDDPDVKDQSNNPLDKYLNGYSKKTRLIVAVSVLGLVLFFVAAFALPFKDKLYDSLFPKKISKAASALFNFRDSFSEVQGQNNLNYLACPRDATSSGCIQAQWDASQSAYIYSQDPRFKISKEEIVPGANHNASVKYTFTNPGTAKLEGSVKRLYQQLATPTPTPSATPAACSVCGADINKDGVVTILDFSRIQACFNKTKDDKVNDKPCEDSDINKDSVVTILDFSCLQSQMNQTCQQATPVPTLIPTSSPATGVGTTNPTINITPSTSGTGGIGTTGSTLGEATQSATIAPYKFTIRKDGQNILKEFRLSSDSESFGADEFGDIPVNPNTTLEFILDSNGDTTASEIELNFTITFTPPQLAVVLVNFQNKPNDKPFTPENIRRLIFDSVKNYYQKNSNNRVVLSGEVFGWYTIPLEDRASTANCPYRNWSEEAEKMVSNQGVNLAGYQYRMFVFPLVANCESRGTVVEKPARAWLFGPKLEVYTFAHEFAHNLGLDHASVRVCTGNNCQMLPHGDPSDLLGFPQDPLYFNAPHQVAMKWIPEEKIRTVAKPESSTASDVYSFNTDVMSLGSSENGYQILKIQKRNNLSEYYYLSYRNPIDSNSFDTKLPTSFKEGLSIHTWDGDPTHSTLLVDTTTNSATGQNDNLDAPLRDGNYYDDEENQISIYQEKHDSRSVSVHVRLGPIPCRKARPTVSIEPYDRSNGAIAKAGERLRYRVKIQSNDSSQCQQTIYKLIPNLPSQVWSFLFATGSILANRHTYNEDLFYITSPTYAAPNTYNIPINFEGADGDNNHKATVNISYTVSPDLKVFVCSACNADITGPNNQKDNIINILDFSKLSSCMNKTEQSLEWTDPAKLCRIADINGDKVVNISDFSCLSSVFNQSCIPTSTSTSQPTVRIQTVVEPTPTPTPTPTPRPTPTSTPIRTPSPTPRPRPLTASCVASPTVVTINQQVTWTATASGGTGVYSYTWGGAEVVRGSGQVVRVSYANPGRKSAALTVRSGNQTKGVGCRNAVYVNYPRTNFFNRFRNFIRR